MTSNHKYRGDVAGLTIGIVANVCRRPTAEVQPTMQLRRDLGLLPLHLVLICSEYEEWTNTVVAVEELVNVQSVDDLIGLLAHAADISEPQQVELPRHAVGSSPNIPTHCMPTAFGFTELSDEEPTWEMPTIVRDLTPTDQIKIRN
jgi:hypothetical protein